jgi:hypothetical protein
MSYFSMTRFIDENRWLHLDETESNHVKQDATVQLRAPQKYRAFELEIGIYAHPLIGSQVNPKLCSRPISAAIKTCLTEPSIQAVKPAAAIDVATPISAIQPPSAALMDARFLHSIPIAAAVNKN